MGNLQKDLLHDMSERLWTSNSKNDFYLQRGVTLLRDGDCQNALEFLSIATEINPKFAEAYGYIGVAFYALGLWVDAMDNYQKALSLDSTLEKVYFFRGVLHSQLTHYQEAVNDFDLAIEWDNLFDDAYCYRGACRAFLNDQKGAIQDLRFAAHLGNRIAQKMLNLKGIIW